MKHMFMMLLFLFAAVPIRAAESQQHDNYWQCTAHDNNQKEWHMRNFYQRVASTKAFEACKKESLSPISCKAPRTACEHSDQAMTHLTPDSDTTLPHSSMWHCVSIDLKAHAWRSRYFKTQDDAAMAAKALCKEHSSIPESCYVNFITCQSQDRT